ncbi:Kelch repeat-containing protein [Azotobacter chroococcum]|nr:kelch repeat-containing protein [Azotobacter chroococcum]
MSHRESARLSFTGANNGSWADLGLLQFPDRQEGMAVLRIDDTVSPPATEAFVVGGGVSGVATWRNPQTLERIDLTDPATAAWSRGADMAFPRVNVTVVLLPNGHLLVVGGQRNGKWAADPQPVLEAEIYDPANNVWTTQAPMLHPRQYHSVAVLLPDGRVLVTGGIDPTLGTTPMRDQRSMELFSPPYLGGGSRPSITSAPASATWGAAMSIGTRSRAMSTASCCCGPAPSPTTLMPACAGSSCRSSASPRLPCRSAPLQRRGRSAGSVDAVPAGCGGCAVGGEIYRPRVNSENWRQARTGVNCDGQIRNPKFDRRAAVLVAGRMPMAIEHAHDRTHWTIWRRHRRVHRTMLRRFSRLDLRSSAASGCEWRCEPERAGRAEELPTRAGVSAGRSGNHQRCAGPTAHHFVESACAETNGPWRTFSNLSIPAQRDGYLAALKTYILQGMSDPASTSTRPRTTATGPRASGTTCR